MINTCDKNIKWTELANQETALVSMISNLRDMTRYMESYSEPLLSDQPFPHYEELYKQHKELLNDIVEIFFYNCTFIPSNINKDGTDEQYMWDVINSIFYIVWFNNIEKKRPRGYKKTLKEIDQARCYLAGYADLLAINKLIHFPLHKNEIIEGLHYYFTDIKRPQQGEKIINKIKEYFGIVNASATNHKKLINANKNFIDQLKKEHSLNDEEVKQIPIIGQLQTKI